MYKKITTIALAVMMIISIFGISTSAIDTGKIGYVIETDAVIGKEVGDIVTVKVYYDMHDDDIATVKLAAGTTTIAYDGDYLEYVANSRTWGDPYSFLKPDSQINTNIWSVISTNVDNNANDNTKGYTNATLFAAAYNVGVPEGATGFSVNKSNEYFTFELRVKKAIDKQLFIGVPEATIGLQSVLQYKDGKKNVKFANTDVVTEKSCKTINSVGVNYAVSTKIRPNADNAANVDLGFTGSFLNAGLPIEFAGGTSTNVSAVGVELTVNGVTNSYQDNFVYANADGNGYNFRVALTGIPAENFNTPIKARMFVIFDGETYYSDYVYTTAAAHVGRLA